MWTSDGFLALPEDAIAFAWSAPMRELASRVGISDVALKKLLNRDGIVTPPQGHWNRVHAGKAVVTLPRPRARRPGERGRLRMDGRFRGHIPEAAPMPEGGPFSSKEVPEDLADLRAQELGKIGRAALPRDLSRPHVGLAKLLRKEEERRSKAVASHWHWDAPHFDGPLLQRQLRLLSGLFTTLARRGYTGSVWEESEELKANCTIGDTTLPLQFSVLGKHRTEMRRGMQRPARDLPSKSPLRLALKRELRADVIAAWEDASDRPLEKRLAEIAADLIVAGEAAFRQSLIESREHAERMRTWEEERAHQRREEVNKERLRLLERSGSLLRQAEDLRALVDRVSAALARGGLVLNDGEFEVWRTWALKRADELDPVISGQILEHIRPQTTK